jgi:hypothetical protein
MSEAVNHPDHYRHPSGVECWQISCQMPHAMGSAFEYVWRHDSKGRAKEDLDKALWWLDNAMKHMPVFCRGGDLDIMRLLVRVGLDQAKPKWMALLTIGLAAISEPNSRTARHHTALAINYIEALKSKAT